MLLFLTAQESENSHSFFTFGDTQGNTLHVPFFVKNLSYTYWNSLPSRNLHITKIEGNAARSVYH